MRIAVAYIYGENYYELAQITIPSLVKFCEKNGYDCITKCVHPNNKGTYAFIKIKTAMELLEHYEVVLMLEGDMLITNVNYKIEDWLKKDKDWYCCKDINGVNTASWICKNTDWAKELLHSAYQYKNELWDEQAYFESLEHSKICYLPHPSINSIIYDLYAPTYGKVYGDKENIPKPTHKEGNWQEGDFILHCPGMTLDMRLKIFNEYKNKIQL